jgi:dihydrofolate reductase
LYSIELQEKGNNNEKNLYFCGGANIYSQVIDIADEMLLLTIKPQVYQGTPNELKFPKIDNDWKINKTKEFEEYTLTHYIRK